MLHQPWGQYDHGLLSNKDAKKLEFKEWALLETNTWYVFGATDASL